MTLIREFCFFLDQMKYFDQRVLIVSMQAKLLKAYISDKHCGGRHTLVEGTVKWLKRGLFERNFLDLHYVFAPGRNSSSMLSLLDLHYVFAPVISLSGMLSLH
jgi:hypothetical protein